MVLRRGLTATANLWPAVQTAYDWVHRAAHILANHHGQDEATVRARYDALLAEMADHRDEAGNLAPVVAHFLKVTDSYTPGLFHCYRVPDLPCTNNDLEHYFGTPRYLERRITGRKVAGPMVVIRGAVRVVAAVATHSRVFEANELRPVDHAKWRALRSQLETRHETRRIQRRFRRDPQTYLATLEDQLLKPTLPS